MLTKTQIQKKIDSLSNKLKAERFDDVIKASILLKNKHQVFFNVLTLLTKR